MHVSGSCSGQSSRCSVYGHAGCVKLQLQQVMGYDLGMPCSVCIREGARFCPQCATPEEEWAHISILFGEDELPAFLERQSYLQAAGLGQIAAVDLSSHPLGSGF